MTNPESIVLSLGNGWRVLVEHWPNGAVAASYKRPDDDVWTRLGDEFVKVTAGSVASS